MKKFFLTLTAALLGICLAVLVHCSFMLVEAGSGSMLQSIAPGQKALIYLLADTDDVAEGDIVAYRQPYYVVDGDNGVLMRRVERVLQDEMVLSCDAKIRRPPSGKRIFWVKSYCFKMRSGRFSDSYCGDENR